MKTSSTSLVNREVQIETIMRYHFTPTRMTIKITWLTKIWRNCNPHLLQMGMSNSEPAMEDSLVAPHKLNRMTTCPSSSPRCVWCVYMYIPKCWKQILKYLNTWMSTEALFTTAKKVETGTSRVAQWLSISLPMQRTQVQTLLRDDSTCLGAASPCVPWLSPHALESMLCHRMSHRSEKLHHPNWRKPAHSSEGPAQSGTSLMAQW